MNYDRLVSYYLEDLLTQRGGIVDDMIAITEDSVDDGGSILRQ